MLTLKTLRVRGFRGFVREQEFRFDSPATVLFGENHSGKSSTLNAIEWCLFGEQCSGKQTTIRERIGWLIPNQHMKSPDVLAELVLEDDAGAYVVRRTLKRPTGKRAPVDSLELTLPGGQTLAGEDAEQRLADLLGASFRDFMTMVYQHQEAIRAVLTQEPRDRNDAIDRLLGLSDYRNLLGAISGADLKGKQKRANQRFEEFENEVKRVLEARERDVEEKRQEAVEAGVARGRLNARTALQLAEEVRRALAEFAGEAGIELAAPEVPGEWRELIDFEKQVKRAVTRARGEMPLAREQQALFQRQRTVNLIKTDLQSARDGGEAIARGIRELDKEYGGQLAVESEIRRVTQELEDERARCREIDGRMALVGEAVSYLDRAGAHGPQDHCPLCGSGVGDLLGRLRHQLEDSMQEEVARGKKNIDRLKGRLQTLGTVADQYRKANDKQEALVREVEGCRREAAGLFGRELTPEDDLPALLEAERERVEGQMQRLNEAVRAKQERLGEIEGELDRVRLVREVLLLEEKKKVIEKLPESAEYRRLAALREQMAELVEDVEEVRDAVSTTSSEEAREKLARAEETIDDYFRKLTRHPALAHVKLAIDVDSRSGRNSYDVTDQNGKDVTATLSQGDLNALALALFLGLAATSGTAGRFGFVLMDDPSQSLGTEHKKQLARVLGEIAGPRKLVLATMDREFHACLAEGLPGPRAEYRFGNWSPESGASTSRQ